MNKSMMAYTAPPFQSHFTDISGACCGLVIRMPSRNNREIRC